MRLGIWQHHIVNASCNGDCQNLQEQHPIIRKGHHFKHSTQKRMSRSWILAEFVQCGRSVWAMHHPGKESQYVKLIEPTRPVQESCDMSFKSSQKLINIWAELDTFWDHLDSTSLRKRQRTLDFRPWSTRPLQYACYWFFPYIQTFWVIRTKVAEARAAHVGATHLHHLVQSWSRCITVLKQAAHRQNNRLEAEADGSGWKLLAARRLFSCLRISWCHSAARKKLGYQSRRLWKANKAASGSSTLHCRC